VGGGCGVSRGSKGKQLPGCLPCLERLTVEHALGLHAPDRHPFFRFPLKYFSSFAVAARAAPSCDSSSLEAAV